MRFLPSIFLPEGCGSPRRAGQESLTSLRQALSQVKVMQAGIFIQECSDWIYSDLQRHDKIDLLELEMYLKEHYLHNLLIKLNQNIHLLTSPY